MMTLKEQHDELLANKPEDAVHDADACPYCNPQTTNEDSDGGGDMKTYTEEEFTAAVQEAVAPVKAEADAKVSELKAELEANKADAAKSEAEGKIVEMQADLDKAEVRVAEAQAKYDDLVAFLNAEAAAAEEQAHREARRESRRAAIQEASRLSEDIIESRLDRWVEMEDAAFEAMLEDWQSVATASAETPVAEVTAPLETAMSNIREDNRSTKSVASEVLGLRNSGIDIRNL
jgi:hypothetical protein